MAETKTIAQIYEEAGAAFDAWLEDQPEAVQAMPIWEQAELYSRASSNG